jgi:hypothetical protein
MNPPEMTASFIPILFRTLQRSAAPGVKLILVLTFSNMLRSAPLSSATRRFKLVSKSISPRMALSVMALTCI